MLKTFYIQLLALIAILCYPINLSADDYSLAPSTGRKVYVPIHAKSAKGLLSITNYGRVTVKNFNYKLSHNGVVILEQKHVMKEALPRMGVATVEIDVPPHSQLSETELQVEITKVNGELNRATIPYANLPRATVTKVPRRRVVVEEYTGMWCKYCPRGIALMENLAHKYGDEFEEEKSMGADMDVDVSAQWDKQKTNITVTPRVTFRVSPKDASYALAYVLTEDGMSKPTWSQNNIYSGDKSVLGISEEMNKFVNSPLVIKGLHNNFSAIAAKGVYTPAIEDYVKTPIEIDKVQSFKHVFDIAHNSLLQDKTKLKVCVLLINLSTKKIENAAKCIITDGSATGISAVEEGQNTVIELERYTLEGRRIHNPQKGINIVRYSDGSVRREIVTH